MCVGMYGQLRDFLKPFSNSMVHMCFLGVFDFVFSTSLLGLLVNVVFHDSVSLRCYADS